MNRGRHKKGKEKEFNTQVEILDTIHKELRVLLSIYNDRSFHSMTDYYAKAGISRNNGKDYYKIVSLYICSVRYFNNFISQVKITLDEVTIKNSIYTIKFEFGHNTKIFKYKHE
ncbi:hypothetical protein [Megamonas funiformis]|uniref:hypothetical protein n=1 Tax=Megamonas funiformis TaxID=437897 RepID=UPI002F926480